MGTNNMYILTRKSNGMCIDANQVSTVEECFEVPSSHEWIEVPVELQTQAANNWFRLSYNYDNKAFNVIQIYEE